MTADLHTGARVCADTMAHEWRSKVQGVAAADRGIMWAHILVAYLHCDHHKDQCACVVLHKEHEQDASTHGES